MVGIFFLFLTKCLNERSLENSKDLSENIRKEKEGVLVDRRKENRISDTHRAHASARKLKDRGQGSMRGKR